MRKPLRRARTKPVSLTVSPPTVWQALNEPVVEVTEGFAKGVFFVAVMVLAMVWIVPHWGSAKAIVSQESSYNLAYSQSALLLPQPMVAGAMISSDEPPLTLYDQVINLPVAVAVAATQVLDVSDGASKWADFYGPGLHSVNEAWLELMMDPY